MADLGVVPGFSFKIIDEDIAELTHEVPSSENHKFVLLSEDTCQMTASRFRRVSLGLGFTPFKCVKIQFVEVVEGSSLIVDTTMASEDDDFIFVVGHGVVGSGFWSSNLAHGVFRRPLGFLVRRLMPLEGG
jgi:hypothetical protein